MAPVLVLIIVGSLLAFIGYLSVQLYINRRILEAFQRAAVVVPPNASGSSSGLRTAVFVFGLILALGFVANLLVR